MKGAQMTKYGKNARHSTFVLLELNLKTKMTFLF